MAVVKKLLGFTSVTQKPILNAVIRREYAVTFAVDAAATLLEPGTPVYQAGGLWYVWSHGHRVMGFIPNAEVQLSTTDQVVANIFSDGEIAYNEIPLPAGEVQAALDSELRILRELGITVQGIPNADGPADDALDALILRPSFIAAGSHVYNPTIS